LIAESKSTPATNPTSPVQNPDENKEIEQKLIAMNVPEKDPLTINKDNNHTEVVTPDNAEPLLDKTDVSNQPIAMVDTDESGKKNKFRGLFRKVTRTFEKRTNIKATDDEDRLLVAGLAIKL